jgi:hypothetical protein
MMRWKLMRRMKFKTRYFKGRRETNRNFRATFSK